MFGLLLWFGAFLLGLVLAAAFGKTWLRVYGLWGLGLLLGFLVVLAIYLNEPPDFAHANGTEGQMYLGRWWDPNFALLLTGFGYFGWAVGVGVGAFGRFLIGTAPKQVPK
jgi:hypothetical protein